MNNSVKVLLAVQALLLAWGAALQSPVSTEIAALPAGVTNWQFGNFDLNRINPPLTRMVAALPVLAAGCHSDWTDFNGDLFTRAEFPVGSSFLLANGKNAFWLFIIARWACIPFSLYGAYVCYQWSRELFGHSGGLISMSLFSFCPYLLGHGQIASTDVVAAAMGIGAGYHFWRWLTRPSIGRSLWAGLFMGLAELAKTTWVVLFVLWPVAWLVEGLFGSRKRFGDHFASQAGQLSLLMGVALLVLNFGYEFDGTLTPLGQMHFASRALRGHSRDFDAENDNRFRGTWLGAVPLPVPASYLQGIDAQKRDFEQPKWSFLNGELRLGGWWYYNLYATWVKLPIGLWVLLGVVVVSAFASRRRRLRWQDGLVILAPAVTVIVLVSSQTAFAGHSRYILPALPFLFIFMGQVSLSHRAIQIAAAFLVVSSAIESLAVFPHSMSFINALAGGPLRGGECLRTSDFDWGQDLHFLTKWAAAHPEAQPLYVAYESVFAKPLLEITDLSDRDLMRQTGLPVLSSPSRPPAQDQWYAISTTYLIPHYKKFQVFAAQQPVSQCGYSIRIYKSPGSSVESTP